MVTVQSCLACHWLGDTGLDRRAEPMGSSGTRHPDRNFNAEALLNSPHSPE
jgi:cytochrome c peroxidase